tara:strand:- start:1511 stop:2422 length:912 start_codon:yes stop_codon:yes gene_type:complete
MDTKSSSSNNIQDDELDIVEIITETWKNKTLIILVTSFFAITSIFYTLNLNDIYKSSSLLKVDDSKTSNPLQSLGGFGSAFMNVGIDTSISKTNLVIELIKSRDFFNFIMDKYNLMPDIMAVKEFDLETNNIIYNELIYNREKDSWIEGIEPPSKQETYEAYLSLIAVFKTEGGFLELSFMHESPIFAKNILDIVIDEINFLESKKDKEETLKAIEYLNDQARLTSVETVKQTIYTILESQMEKLMTANIKSDYLIEVIDAPYIPEKKFKPSRALMVILATFFGLILSIVIVFFSKVGIRKIT